MSGKRLAEAASRLIVHIRPISNVHRSVRREQETRVLSRLHQSIIFICCTFMAVLCGLSSGPRHLETSQKARRDDDGTGSRGNDRCARVG